MKESSKKVVVSQGSNEEAWMASSPVARFLIARNKAQSEEFVLNAPARRQYMFEHPTQFMAFKCMDGRLNLSVMTGTLPGIIKPYRNLGAQFHLGWPYLGSLVERDISTTGAELRSTIPFSTYHFSRSNPRQGCAAFEYDTTKAKAAASELQADFENIYQGSHAWVYPIIVGIETDEDALIFHGNNGQVLDLGEKSHGDMAVLSQKDLISRLTVMFPDMPQVPMVNDLVRLIMGNQKHIQEVRLSKRPPERLDHQEQVIAYGRGFDWLHWPNKALIVGPYGFNPRRSIAKAAGIILNNLKEGKIPKDEGVVLMTSAVYDPNITFDMRRAVLKAKELFNFSRDVIKEDVPDLLKYQVTPLVGILDPSTRRYTLVGDSPDKFAL